MSGFKITEIRVIRKREQVGSKTRVYVTARGIDDGMVFGMTSQEMDKAYRAHWKQLREALPVVSEHVPSLQVATFGFSSRAGCSCGCSPGFIASEKTGFDVYVTLDVDNGSELPPKIVYGPFKRQEVQS